MSKSKIVGMMVLIVFAMGILLVGDVVAGEKFKGRTVTYTTKWQPIEVGDEDGHVVAVYESRGISTNLDGKRFLDGCPLRETGLVDINLKTGLGSGHGYGDWTDRDGSKNYYTWKGKLLKGGKFGTGYWDAVWTIVKGTGKFEGIKAEGTASGYFVAPGQQYNDWEVEVELPR
ncbi:MAG: hypothetical protein ABSB32_17265 [Thermodesulfobacteriota bacterium]|jgi:hypothetical protein